MTDDEFNDYHKCGFSFFTSAIFLPAIIVLFSLFGYTKINVTIFEIVFLALVLISFFRKDWFLRRYKHFISKRQYLFQTISYFVLIIYSVIAAFLVNKESVDGKTVLTYYPGNFIVFLGVLIYSFVVVGFMAKTAKNIMSLVKQKYDSMNQNY